MILPDPSGDKAKDVKVPAHRVILAMNSHFFKEAFAGTAKEATLPPLPDDPMGFLPKLVDIAGARKLVLELCYNLEWSQRFDEEMKRAEENGSSAELALGVFACSSALRCSRIVEKAAAFVGDLITIYNAAGILYAAELLGSGASISADACQVLRSNFSSLSGQQMRLFCQLPLPTLKSVLGSTDLTVDGDDESVVKDAVRTVLYCRMDGALQSFDLTLGDLEVGGGIVSGWHKEVQVQALAFEKASYRAKAATPFLQELKAPFYLDETKKDEKDPPKFTGKVAKGVQGEVLKLGVPALGVYKKPEPKAKPKAVPEGEEAEDPLSPRSVALKELGPVAQALTECVIVLRVVHKDGKDGSSVDALVPSEELLKILDAPADKPAEAKVENIKLTLGEEKDKTTLTVSVKPSEAAADPKADPKAAAKPAAKPGTKPPEDDDKPERNPAFFNQEMMDQLVACVRWGNMSGPGLQLASKDPVLKKAAATEQITEAMCYRLQQHEQGYWNVASSVAPRKGGQGPKKSAPHQNVAFPEFALMHTGVDMERGVFHYLATRGFADRWKSPIRLGAVEVLLNKRPEAQTPLVHGSAEDLLSGAKKQPVGHGYGYLRMRNDLDSAQLGIDLKFGFLELTSYCLRNASSSSQSMTAWEFHGSNTGNLDDRSWQVLDSRTNFQGLRQSHATQNFKLNEKSPPYRFFRLKMTGPNSSGSDNMLLAGLELYGVFHPKGLPPGRRPDEAPLSPKTPVSPKA